MICCRHNTVFLHTPEGDRHSSVCITPALPLFKIFRINGGHSFINRENDFTTLSRRHLFPRV